MMDSKVRDITMACLQRSALTYSVNHTVLETRVNAQRSFSDEEIQTRE